MTNPQALQALLKIQHGLDVLHSSVPNFGKSSSHPSMSTPPTASDLSNHILPADGTEDGSAPTADRSTFDPVSTMMTQIVQQMSSGQIELPFEERYVKQLEYLNSMGFSDQKSNLEALIGTFGDVNAAAERILRHGGQLL